MTPQEFGETLKEMRMLRNMTQCALAAKAEVANTKICDYENGRRLPSLPMFRRIVIALEIPANQLLKIE